MSGQGEYYPAHGPNRGGPAMGRNKAYGYSGCGNYTSNQHGNSANVQHRYLPGVGQGGNYYSAQQNLGAANPFTPNFVTNPATNVYPAWQAGQNAGLAGNHCLRCRSSDFPCSCTRMSRGTIDEEGDDLEEHSSVTSQADEEPKSVTINAATNVTFTGPVNMRMPSARVLNKDAGTQTALPKNAAAKPVDKDGVAPVVDSGDEVWFDCVEGARR